MKTQLGMGRALGVISRLTSLVQEDCVDKTMQEPRPDRDKGISCEDTWGSGIAG